MIWQGYIIVGHASPLDYKFATDFTHGSQKRFNNYIFFIVTVYK